MLTCKIASKNDAIIKFDMETCKYRLYANPSFRTG